MIKYFKESFAELNNVTWPTRKQGVKITTIVFIFMVISAIVLGIVDYLFSLGLESLLKVKQTTQMESQVTPSDENEAQSATPEAIEVDSISTEPAVNEEEVSSSSAGTSTDSEPQATPTDTESQDSEAQTQPSTSPTEGEVAAPADDSVQNDSIETNTTP